MSAVNAFNWKAFTDESHAKEGDPFKSMKRGAEISRRTTECVAKIRETKPSHGTVAGITDKPLEPRAPDMMRGGARPNAGRKLPKIDERRAMHLLSEGLTKKEIADRFNIPYKTMLTLFKNMGAAKVRGEYDWTGKYAKDVSKSKAT